LVCWKLVGRGPDSFSRRKSGEIVYGKGGTSCEGRRQDMELHVCGDRRQLKMVRDLLHAPRASSPVTIVEVEAFALEDKCAHAILGAPHQNDTHLLKGR